MTESFWRRMRACKKTFFLKHNFILRYREFFNFFRLKFKAKLCLKENKRLKIMQHLL